jgi:hypothetical protein
VRNSTRIGFCAVALGMLVLVVPAVLPVRVVATGPGVRGLQAVDDGCGAAAHAALRYGDRQCGQVARERLQLTVTVGLLVVVAGLVVLAGRGGGSPSRVSPGGRAAGHHP